MILYFFTQNSNSRVFSKKYENTKKSENINPTVVMINVEFKHYNYNFLDIICAHSTRKVRKTSNSLNKEIYYCKNWYTP